MSAARYGKLVRDRIPEIIGRSGRKAVVETLGEREYKERLDRKLGEELQEYLDGDDVEELADLMEVVYAILKYKKVSPGEFEEIRKKKAAERGAFDGRLLLKEVTEE